MLTDNVPASVFNVLVAAFFIVVLLGVVLGAYAAIQLRKCQEQLRAYQEADATPAIEPEPASTQVSTSNAEPEV